MANIVQTSKAARPKTVFSIQFKTKTRAVKKLLPRFRRELNALVKRYKAAVKKAKKPA